MKKPTFCWMDKVEFIYEGTEEPLVGLIEIIDANGTFGQTEEVSYDIYVGEGKNCLYKHVPESQIRRKMISEPITRGILEYNEQNDSYAVIYSPCGYAAVLDSPSFAEIRLTGTDQWISVAFVIKEMPEHLREEWMNLSIVSLKEWIGKSVEIRYIPPYMQVCELIHTHQDDSDMIYEIYREDANVVLYDGSFVIWKPENMVLRGGNHHVLEYYHHQVFRWDVVDGVMRLCLGPIPEPKPETLDSARKWMEMLEERENKVPNVPDDKKFIVERLRREEFPELGLKRMISHANYIGRTKNTEILTPVTKHGFEYKKDKEWHKVYYQPGWIYDAVVHEE